MAEIIGLITFLLCLVVWLGLSLSGIANKRRRKRANKDSQGKQGIVESRIRKIEDVYGEQATIIKFQKLPVPNMSELLVILEEAQMLLILSEAYNFSEILNLKVGTLDYIRLKQTNSAALPTHILEKAAAGIFSGKTIKEALSLHRGSMNSASSLPDKRIIKIEIMTSRIEYPVISLFPTSHSSEEIIIALSIIIDKNKHKWTSEGVFETKD